MDNDAEIVVKRVVQGIEALGLDYLIGGSFASGAWGQFRPTHDLDMALRILPQDIDSLVHEFQQEFALSKTEMEEAISSQREFASFQLLHFERLFKIDMFIADDSPFAVSEMARRRRVELMPGVDAYIATPEDIVLQKLRWYELGNRVSDRQWNDIIQVIQVQDTQLDRDYIRKWAETLGLTELAEEAFKEAEIY